jgi:hypothetical protein
MSAAAHVSKVRLLYKTILRLHRGLPPGLKGLGDEYVRDEFRRHKNAEHQFVPIFMEEWRNYAVTLAGQLGRKASYKVLGVPLPEERLSDMTEQQIGQLFELFREAQKPLEHPEHPTQDDKELRLDQKSVSARTDVKPVVHSGS